MTFRTCGFCLMSKLINDGTMLKCARCRLQHYCSKECQVSHWKFHKTLCSNNSNKTLQQKKKDKSFGKWLSVRNTLIIFYIMKHGKELNLSKNVLLFKIIEDMNGKFELLYISTDEKDTREESLINESCPVNELVYIVHFQIMSNDGNSTLRAKPYSFTLGMEELSKPILDVLGGGDKFIKLMNESCEELKKTF